MILKIIKEQDINILMVKAKNYFNENGLSEIKSIELTTIISELGYNIVKYTKRGTIKFDIDNHYITIVSKDEGFGIADISSAVCEGYSSSGTLGLGLNGIIRLSDEFEMKTSKNGTTITIKKILND